MFKYKLTPFGKMLAKFVFFSGIYVLFFFPFPVIVLILIMFNVASMAIISYMAWILDQEYELEESLIYAKRETLFKLLVISAFLAGLYLIFISIEWPEMPKIPAVFEKNEDTKESD